MGQSTSTERPKQTTSAPSATIPGRPRHSGPCGSGRNRIDEVTAGRHRCSPTPPERPTRSGKVPGHFEVDAVKRNGRVCDSGMSGERTMPPGGSRSKGTIACLIASCVLSARWVFVAAVAAVLVFSSPLSITSSPFQPAHSSHKAPRISITKVKALSTTSERSSSSCRAARRRVTKRPYLLSISSPSHNDPQPIFRPLRC